MSKLELCNANIHFAFGVRTHTITDMHLADDFNHFIHIHITYIQFQSMHFLATEPMTLVLQVPYSV